MLIPLALACFSAVQQGWYVVLQPLPLGVHHSHHFDLYGKDAPGYNVAVLRGVDKVQATQPDGGGYFADPKASPAESPVGYALKLLGNPLLTPPRTTSYCSGSSYAALIETLNLIFAKNSAPLSPDRLEAMRMQEPNGGRRNDFVKAWGDWNADGPGSEYALVQYTGMGLRISPDAARPGDFINIDWKSGLGHSVVFLGWTANAAGQKSVLFWSSQKGTNGYGDEVAPLDSIKDVIVVRLTHPERLYTFDPGSSVQKKVAGDPVSW